MGWSGSRWEGYFTRGALRGPGRLGVKCCGDGCGMGGGSALRYGGVVGSEQSLEMRDSKCCGTVRLGWREEAENRARMPDRPRREPEGLNCRDDRILD
jgi:hypothetical protein